MTNHLADELRQILDDLGDDPHASVAIERIRRLVEHVEQVGEPAIRSDALVAAARLLVPMLGNAVVTPELDAAPAADRGYRQGWLDCREAVAQAIEEADRHVDVTAAEMAATARATAPAADPGVYQLPDEPAGPLWDNISRRWERGPAGGWVHTMGKGERRSSLHMTWHDLLDFVTWLSATPPAGTDAQ